MSTLAGKGGIQSDVVGPGSTARFKWPRNLFLHPDSSQLFVSDGDNHKIKRVTLSADGTTGTVTTLAGDGSNGFADGLGAAARLFYPRGLSLAVTSGILYVGDSYNNCIRMITPVGFVSIFVGNLVANSIDGIGTDAAFNRPDGLALNSDETRLL